MPLLSKLGSSPAVEIPDVKAPPFARKQVLHKGEGTGREVSSQWGITIASKPLRGDQLARLAVLLTFCDPLPEQCLQMLALSTKDWSRLLCWLDVSGLALYFLNRLVELDLCDLLPSTVFTRLHLNLIDNAERTRGMISESVAIQREFQRSGLSYAILKGLSLWPSSVPEPELRLQFDLDFLVGQKSAREARRILERRGYRLYAVNGRSWEFKLNERPGVSLKDIYKHMRSYAVELHVESSAPDCLSPLDRLEWRELYDTSMPVLSPVDLFLGQGLHAYRHVCGEFSRASHLLEFRRHVLSRRDDKEFWTELEWTVRNNPQASIGLGVVVHLITGVMGDFAPKALTRWTVDRLSAPVRLWVKMYGYRAVLGSHPGSKLHLLLQGELETEGISVKRPVRRSLLPSQLPPMVIRAFPNEHLSLRLRRYSMQLHFVFDRMRFHIVEGLRFALESRRWRRIKRIAQ
ncbi:MAG: nucleotidyltransferase family protein [Terracidiphilus sp.]